MLKLRDALVVLQLAVRQLQSNIFRVAHELRLHVLVGVLGACSFHLKLLADVLHATRRLRLDLVDIELHAMPHILNLTLSTSLGFLNNFACLLMVLIDPSALLF